MRTKRIKIKERPATYHLISRTVAGEWLLEMEDREVLRSQMRKMAAFCGVEVLTYCILSNHFHMLVKVPPKQSLPDRELVGRYAVLYGEEEAGVLAENLENSPRREEIREGLLRRMHDISFFMKELKMRFTIYYNHKHNRFGTLWAERFKSLLVESRGRRDAVLAVAAYIDLNPVRAGLCTDPKEYRFCGYAEAVGGNALARAGLSWVVGRCEWSESSRAYRLVVFGTGAMSDRSRQGGIDPESSRKVLEAGGELSWQELLRCPMRYFSDGLALGSARFVATVRRQLFGQERREWKAPKMPAGGERELYFARRRRSTGREQEVG